MPLPGTGRMLWGHQPSRRNRVIIKVSYRCSEKYLLGCMYQEWDLSIHMTERYTLGPLSKAHSISLASTWLRSWSQRMLHYGTSKEYLPGNEIELGMVIPTFESRASKISRDKGNGIFDIVVQPIKDLRWICWNYYGYPWSRYWLFIGEVSRSCPHVLEPVGSHT